MLLVVVVIHVRHIVIYATVIVVSLLVVHCVMANISFLDGILL